ncbi:MAG: bifunctional riboflavin kinase/FMN adenylyltransferase [Phycisphaerales bacterium]|nr:bifunctional riboflavin kinase/FMN adenylyltransferase [Phycisphaerae bacterium]NNF44505.1 bifunctional riboflavin kinase/FMN adenylyltransferase [Phycisphaerales bacterium]NNM26121.1 bifunctional riboflavin kinase/FMN adenylyltransferase [Phycisphaerales bacterium]
MPRQTALTIGNFDGVHRGHAALLSAARDAVGDEGRVVVLCFDPHPLTVLRPEAVPPRLTHFADRVRLLGEAGADTVVRVPPTPERLRQTPEAFVDEIVVEHRPVAIVEGRDFRFGRDRAGSIETLESLGGRHGFETIALDAVEVALDDQHVVPASSTITRWLLARGRVRDAANVLGRDYELTGTVVSGDRRGRTIGFPTANLEVGEQLLPGDGIYAGFATRGDRTWPAAVSVGTKPTYGTHPRVCEAHLVGYDGPVDDYGWTIRVRLSVWLRGQIRYDDTDTLVAQLHRDVAATTATREATVA